MTDSVMGALIGMAGSAALGTIGAWVRALRNDGNHAVRLSDVEDKVDGHEREIRAMPDKYVPRTELATRLDSMGESQRRTERWVEYLVTGKAQSPESK
jgi:hypothetical protein